MLNKRYKHFRPVKRPTEHYKHYEKLMDREDREMLKIMNTNLDTLLIFAALFSAVNSAFIALSVVLLQQTPGDTSNQLLCILVKTINNATQFPNGVCDDWGAPAGATRVNCLFCASLAGSVVVSLCSIVGKQWLLHYDRSSDVDPFQKERKWRPLGNEHRGRERHMKLVGLQVWQLRPILEALLPTLLQVSVFVFFIGLIDFFRLIKPMVAWITLAVAAVGFILYMAAVIFAIRDPNCPYQTPVSTILIPWLLDLIAFVWKRLLHPIFKYLSRLVESDFSAWDMPPIEPQKDETEKHDSYEVSTADIQIVSWILSTSMEEDPLRSAAASLPLVIVPTISTARYVDPSAISHLLFLLRDAIESITPSALLGNLPDNVDAVIYSRALFHLFLSSYIDWDRTKGSYPPMWWASYLEVLGPAITRTPVKLLKNHDRVVRLIKDGGQGLDFFKDPPNDLESLPLYVAGLTIARVVCQRRGDNRFHLGDFWTSVARPFEHRHSKDLTISLHTTSTTPQYAKEQVPWSAVNVVAWALASLMDASPDAPPPIKDPNDVWDAYTSDANIWENIILALRAYERQAESNTESRSAIQEMYILVLEETPGLIDEADPARPNNEQQNRLEAAALAIAVKVASQFVRGSTIRQTSGLTDLMLGEDPEREKQKEYELLGAALKAVRVEAADHERLQPLWKIIAAGVDDSKAFEILIDFLRQSFQLADSHAVGIFITHPTLRSAIQDAVVHPVAEVRSSALSIIQRIVEKMDRRVPLSDTTASMFPGLATDLASVCRTPTFNLVGIKDATITIIRRLSTRPADRQTILHAFYEAATATAVQVTCVEVALETWWACFHEDAPPADDWFADGVLGAVVQYVESIPRHPPKSEPISDALAGYARLLRRARLQTPLALRFESACQRLKGGALRRPRMPTRERGTVVSLVLVDTEEEEEGVVSLPGLS